MTWVDGVVLLVLAGFVVMQSRRGFAPSLVDFLGSLAAFRLTLLFYRGLQDEMISWFHVSVREGYMLAGICLFSVLMIGVFVASKIFHDLTQISFDEGLDSLLGVFLGVALSISMMHVYLAFIYRFGSEHWHVLLKDSPLASEIIHYYTYHGIITFLTNMGS